MTVLHIIHTNDLHSHLENWPAITQEIDAYRNSLSEKDELLVVDIGDHIDRSHIYTEATKGKGNVMLLNNAGYDYVTIGNNEGITLSYEQLNTLYEDADFQVVISNFFKVDGNRPDWVQPYCIHETLSGLRIGIIGVTAAYDDYYQKLGWHVTDPLEAVKTTVQLLQNQTDAIICLAHVGRSMEEEIATHFPQVHLILGAHTHHMYPDHHKFNQSSLSAGGKWGNFLGIAQLSFASNLLIDIQTRLFPISDSLYHGNDQSISQHNAWMNEGESLLNETLFTSKKLLKVSWTGETALSTLLGEALIDYTEADCALLSAGLFLTSLEKGEVTAKMMHDLLPHPINPCVVECKGADLIEAYTIAQNEKWTGLEVKGLGFRGKVLGKLIFHHFVKKGTNYYINGQLLEVDKVYRLATIDMFTFGYFFPRFKELPKTYYMPETIRDIFISYYQRNHST